MKTFLHNCGRLLALFSLILTGFYGTNINAQWIQTTGPYGWEFNHFAEKNATVLAGSPSQGIYRSDNSGLHWTDANNGLWATTVTALAVNQQYFLAGVYDGSGALLFLSEDDGVNWSQINTVNPTKDITCFVEKDTILFMGTYGDGVYRSSDGGLNWTKANNSGLEHPVLDLAVIDSVILAGTMGGGVYMSTDDGESWTMLPGPDFNYYVTSMCVINKVLYVAYAGTVYKTANRGSDWTKISTGLPSSYSGNLYANGTNLYLGTDQGIFFSTDGGSNWSNIGLVSAIVHKMVVSGDNLIAGTRDLGIFTSSDNGQNWVQTGALDNMMIQAMAALNSNFITGNNGQEGIFVSRDNGKSFTEHYNLNHSYVLALKVRGTDIFAGTEVANTGGGGIFKSSDSGKTWERIGLQNVIVVSFTYHHSYLFAGTVQGVYRTKNEGAIWNYVNNGLNSLRVDALETVDTLVYAGTGYGVYRTTDNGDNWSPFGLADTLVSSLLNVDNTLYASTPFGIYMLSNNDPKWVQVGLPDTFVYKLEANQSMIFAGTTYGVYASEIDGSRWVSINDGLDFNITTLAINDNYLFAGTWGEGVWSRDLLDISTGIDLKTQNTPNNYSLRQNYPNPFNPSTTIEFTLPNSEYTEIKVYNVLGKEVSTVVSKTLNQGNHTYQFDGKNLASGVYYYQLVAGDYREVKKMILLR